MAAPLRHLPNAEPTQEVRVADVVLDTLANLGIDTFYGIPGGAIASVYDGLNDRPDLRMINARQETGAVYMAMGHSRVSGNIPCVLMTSGPGITNGLTGLAAAHADGIPLIALAGEVPRKNFGRGALQEGSRYQLDILGMVRSVTKFAAEISTPRSAASMVRKAVATARSGRQGPVFLSLPLDVANSRVLPVSASGRVSTSFEMDDESLTLAATALQNCKRGVLMVGSGARSPDAARLVATVARTLQIPVCTTPKAKGVFPESDPLSLGVFGHGGHSSANRYLEGGVDVLMCIGCGLGETATNSWSDLLQPSNTFIQIDIDSGQIGKNYHVDLGLVGPASVVLLRLLAKLNRRQPRALSTGVERTDMPGRETDTTPLKPPRILRLLQEVMPKETIFTSDVGEHMIFAIHHLQIDLPDAFIVNSGLGAMGSGIGAAVGAKLALPGRPVVSICGDFGFQMQGMELATCVQEEIGVVFAIFNDGRMRMVESGLNRIFGRSKRMDGPRVDFAALGRALGARGYTIRTADDLRALNGTLGLDGVPTVLDIDVDPNTSFGMNARVAELKSFRSDRT